MPDISTYMNYFIGGNGQFLIIIASIALLFGLGAIGRAVTGNNGLAEANTFVGWSVAVIIFTVTNIFFQIPFTYSFWLLVAGGGVAIVWSLKTGDGIGPAQGFWRVLVIAAPLLLIASARMASEWDEFSHWLPTTRYMFEAQQFPFGGREISGGHFPGYPYAWLFLPYMANMLAGQLVEGAGSTLNIMLLLIFGVGAVRLWFAAQHKPMTNRAVLTWTGALFVALAATLLNPTFVQKVILTTYADASTAAALGIGTVLMYFILDALASGDREKARNLSWQLGFVLAVLINIKQSNLVLVVMLAGGGGIVALRDPAISLGAFFRLLPIILLPATLIYGVWRYHVTTNLPVDAEAMFLPYEQWNTHILWPIFQKMLVVASKKIGYYGVMAIAAGFALRGLWRCRSGFDRLAMLIGLSFLGYNAFLYLIFVTQFGEYDAGRVASYWRYNHHLGLMAVAFGAFGLGTLWHKYMAGRTFPRHAVTALFVIVFIAPFIFAKKLRFDLEHPKPFYRAVGLELPELMPVGSKVYILDPLGTGESGVLTRYPLWKRRTELLGYRAAYHNFEAEPLRQSLLSSQPDHLLIHSVKPVINEVLGTELPEKGFSTLLRATDDGWTIVKQWPRSDGHWAGR